MTSHQDSQLPPLELDMPLDEGIREHVMLLREAGIDTIQSCQGGPGHSSPEPMIWFNGNQWEGFKAFAIAKTYGLDVLDVAFTYSENAGWLEGPYWVMRFRSLRRT